MGTTLLAGGCACGAVRYESETAPVAMANCHCRDCQRTTGSAYAPIVVLPRPALRIVGELRYHRIVGEAGKAVERGFCPTCGSSVAARLERLPDVVAVLAGTLDDTAQYRPGIDLFTDSAPPWDHLSPDTRKLPRGMED